MKKPIRNHPQASTQKSSSLEHCDDCSSTRFRPSRWRVDDLLHLLLLQWPMRCTDCKRRQHMFLPHAIQSVSALSAAKVKSKAHRAWQESGANRKVQRIREGSGVLKSRNAH